MGGADARRRSGATAVEFALIAPALLSLIFLCLDGAWQAMTAATLDRVAREASRYGATGADFPSYLPPAVTAGLTPRSPAAMVAIATWFGAGILRADRLTITLESAAAATGLGTPAAAQGTPGGAGDSVLYTFRYAQPAFTPYLQAVVGNALVHRARALIRNEAFPSATP